MAKGVSSYAYRINMVKFILSRLHPRPERRGFTLHMHKKMVEHDKAMLNSTIILQEIIILVVLKTPLNIHPLLWRLDGLRVLPRPPMIVHAAHHPQQRLYQH